jgi:hypothetical protein
MQLQILLLLLFTAGLSSAEQDSAVIADNPQLAFPPNLETGADTLPKFLVDIYNCWNSLGANHNRASCLPVRNQAANIDDVNEVRTIKGTGKRTASGVLSHTPHHQSSLTYHFNMSLRHINEDTIRYAYIRIPKQAETLKKRCNSPISLQLLMRAHSNESADTPRNIFTLLSSTQLTQGDIGRSFHVEFSDITQQFKQWQAESTRQSHLRLVIRSSCHHSLAPEDLGFRPNTSAFIVVFSKSDGSEETLTKPRLAIASRRTRSTQDGSNMREEDGDNERDADSSSGDEPATTNPTDSSFYHPQLCQLHSRQVSFEDLGLGDYILYPREFELNYCAGGCTYPLLLPPAVTWHAYIQNLASLRGLDDIPPPCCVPLQLGSVTVLYRHEEEGFILAMLHDMTARSCACK